MRGFARYLRNCFWLIVPVLAINVAGGPYLPPAFQADVFWADIPVPIAFAETLLRILTIALPIFMALRIETGRQNAGLAIYLAGLAAYAIAWVALILAPDSAWSTSFAGFTAPAWTPLLWLLGIALIGDRLLLPLPWRWWIYAVASVAFVAVHVAHAAIAYGRLAGGA